MSNIHHREPETEILFDPDHGRSLRRGKFTQPVNDILDHVLRRRGAGSLPDRDYIFEPFLLDGVNMSTRSPGVPASAPDFSKPVAVGTVVCSDHQDEVDDRSQLANRSLAILRGITDVRFQRKVRLTREKFPDGGLG